jgi:hypothetical protein
MNLKKIKNINGGKKIMKRITVLAIVFIIVAFTNANAEQFKGYLSDVICGTSGIEPYGSDLTINPGKNTIETMRTPACAASGYGIFIYNNYYKRFIFHKFDRAGSDMAKKQIIDVYDQNDNVAIIVDGTPLDDGSIKVSRIMQDKNIRLKGEGAKKMWENE